MNNARCAIEALVALEPIKVWSLIITLFGDRSAKGASVALSGKQIRGLLEHIGVKADTTRVALHRLKKEGWITTAKHGREVAYRLSDHGCTQTASAYDDVYRQSVKYETGWKLQLSLQETGAFLPGAMPVLRNIVLLPEEAQDTHSDNMDLSLVAADVPPWFVNLVLPPKHLAIAEGYLQIVANLGPVIECSAELDKSALRLLIVHHWRKMALRNSTWFHIWVDEQGAFGACHRWVMTLLLGSLYRRPDNAISVSVCDHGE
ncbi:MAG: hypothetical protein AB8B64_18330 [Granulosicoccus sp.]